METKKCSKCGVEKELGEFNRDRKAKNGLHSICKKCKKLYQVIGKDEYYKRHKEWRDRNKDKIRARDKIYEKNNREKISNQSKIYRNKLSDSYIIDRLRKDNPNLTTEEIKANPELIRLKRLSIQLYREHLKEKNNE